MASITDCVVEGLKYPFNDIKKLLSFGVLFALLSAISTFISIKSFDIFRTTVHIAEMTNSTVSHISFSQLPAGDIYLTAGLIIVGFIITLFIFGYQYDLVKFSIDKKDDLPGFANIVEIFIKGIKYFLVVLAYNIIPALLLVLAMVFVNNVSVFLAIVFIAIIVAIIADLLLIMALNNMIAYDDIKKAFDLREITGNISNLGWGKYIGILIFTCIVFMIIMFAVSFVLGIISAIFAATISNQAIVISFVIAIIEGLLIDSYGTVFLNRVFGSIYRESIK